MKRKKISTSFSILPEDRDALTELAESCGVGVNALVEGAVRDLLESRPDDLDIPCPTCKRPIRIKVDTD